MGNNFLIKRSEQIFYWSTALLIIASSFYYYAPCNYKFFNSDNAIQVLMSFSFSWPRDVYYWGQNRLGSLLPFIASLLLSFIKIHPLYICSFVQYMLLAIPSFIICECFKSTWVKLSLLILIFFPISSYYPLVLIGHPYASQLFSGVLFCHFFLKFYKEFNKKLLWETKNKFHLHLLFFASWFFYLLGIWASEFNAILIIIPLVFFINDRKIPRYRNYPSLYLHAVLAAISIFLTYYYLKSVALKDNRYDKVLFYKYTDIQKEFGFLIHKIKTTLTFNDHRVLENWYYYFLILVIFGLIFSNKNEIKPQVKVFVKSLLITSLVSFVFLFFSVWNLISEIGVRYYIPVYLMTLISLLLLIDYSFSTRLKMIFFSLMVFFSLTFTYLTLIQHNQPGPFKKFGDFAQLPKGTLIANYWSCYQINAVACYNLQSLPFHDEYVRNWNWRDVALAENNIYFIKDPTNRSMPMLDTLSQYGNFFVWSGITYKCNDIEVRLYHPMK